MSEVRISEPSDREPSWREVVRAVFAQTAIASPHAFTFGGREHSVPAVEEPAAPAGAGPEEAMAPLVGMLSTVLYHAAYSRPFAGALPEESDRSRGRVDPELVRSLSAANASRERWEHGWVIAQLSHHGQVLAQRGNVRRNLWPGQYLSQDGPGAPPRPGAQITLFYARESTSLQHGFYYAFGEAPEDDGQGFGVVRFYWNLAAPGGAPELVRALSARLNRFHVPFRFKCALADSEYDRTDVAVLYLGKRYSRITLELLLDVYPEIRDRLAAPVPLFSRPLAPGLGVAEDPGSGESFGQHRCRLLAEAMGNGFLRGESSVAWREAELRRLCAAQGIDPERPHLNAGSVDWYELPGRIDEAA